LRQLLLNARFDVVISHSDWTRAIFGPVVREVGIPLVYWLHGSPSGRHWLKRWAMRTSSDFVICNSRFTAGLLAVLDPAVPKEVLYNAVPPPETKLTGTARSELRKRFGASDDSVVILQVSRMESLKGHRSHIDALALIKDNPRWICWLVGGPQRPAEQPYFENLQRLVAQNKLEDRVQFLGSRSDVMHLMDAADIFCQPNESPESFGIVFVEALWAGLPVVSTAIGGAEEIILNSGCGILIQPKDSVALAGCLGRLIMDDLLRSRMGANGPSRARELCSPDRQISRLSNLLHTSARKASAA
jgi:glycosyltransferase involved in cell wall biosynthesis